MKAPGLQGFYLTAARTAKLCAGHLGTVFSCFAWVDCFAAGAAFFSAATFSRSVQFQLGLGVGHVAENLHPSGILLRRNYAIVLVNGQARQRAELAGQQSVVRPSRSAGSLQA